MEPEEFPKLEAGSLRPGFTVIFEGKVRRILKVHKRKFTIKLTFNDKYESTIANETLIEVLPKNE